MRLLKFDSIHPHAYLQSRQTAWKDEITSWSRSEYYKKLIALRCNFSDFYTYNLNQLSWQAEEYFINDWMYTYKLANELYGNTYKLRRFENLIKQRAGFAVPEWNLKVVCDYIEEFKPDVIFCREHTNIPSNFWKPYKNKLLLVSRLSAHLPANWSPLDFDLIYTDLPHYRDFFEFNKIETLHNHHGFDERILSELTVTEQTNDVVFIGGLDQQIFSQRTAFLTEVAKEKGYQFSWWGYYSGTIDQRLIETYKGLAAGIEMFNIYKNSKIVINDYIDIAGGTAVNQRIFEVMGTGALLLTRESPTINTYFPKGTVVTYTNLEDCKEKISYYLQHEQERKQIAASGQSVILEKYNYKDLMKILSGELKERIKK
jgi:Glycosyl transferases group 1